MSVQRFLPVVERTRRTVGWVFLAVGSVAVAGLLWAFAGPGGMSGTTLGLVAIAAALTALGLRLAVKRKVVLEIDPDGRTYRMIRDGSPGASGPLDALGPLAVSMRTRTGKTKNGTRTIVVYVVTPHAQASLDFFVEVTPGKARQKMEAVARAWHLPCRSFGGAVREAGTLDTPLHERLRGNREAKATTPLRPEWNLRIEPLSPGYTIVSTHRSWAPLGQSALILLPALFVLGAVSGTGLLSTLRSAGGDLLDRIFLGLLAIVLLALLWKLWQGARDTFFPGAIQITEQGVRYRGSRMAFDEIEEVTGSIRIELVGDRRILAIPASFCPAEATNALTRELQRMILEVAPMSPQAN